MFREYLMCPLRLNYLAHVSGRKRDCSVYSQFRQSIKIGETSLTKRQVEMLIMEMGSQYAGKSYNIISRNCNHFTDDLGKRLCKRGIPSWINRLAFMGKHRSLLFSNQI